MTLQILLLAATSAFLTPMTTRRYLQGPESSRVITYCREGKVLLGEVEHMSDWSLSYWDLAASGVWLVRDNLSMLPLESAILSQPLGGAPIHSQRWCEDGVEITLSACVPFGRFPSAALRVELYNHSEFVIRKDLALLARTGKEVRLAADGAPDFYCVYRPAVSNWLALTVTPPNFVKTTSSVTWDARVGAFRLSAELSPNACAHFDFTLGKGEFAALDFDQTASAVRADWARLLMRVNSENSVVRDLLVTMLQSFARPVEGDFVLPRQGGQQRYVWPGETIHVFAALDRYGYCEYVDRANDFYLTQCVRESGEAGPFRNCWAADTAFVLHGFSRHCLDTANIESWHRHASTTRRMFNWIARQREADGLFPALKSTDSHAQPMKHWGMTDLSNLAALDWYARAAVRFADPIAAEAERVRDDYRAAIVCILDRWRNAASGHDELFLPITPDGSREDELVKRGFFYLHPSAFAVSGLLTVDDLLRLRTWLIRRGRTTESGLYLHHPSRKNVELGEHVWYTTWCEYEWYCAWRRVARDDLAEAARNAAFATALTREHVTGERWHDENAWYFPWSPNASAAARLLMMLP